MILVVIMSIIAIVFIVLFFTKSCKKKICKKTKCEVVKCEKESIPVSEDHVDLNKKMKSKLRNILDKVFEDLKVEEFANSGDSIEIKDKDSFYNLIKPMFEDVPNDSQNDYIKCISPKKIFNKIKKDLKSLSNKIFKFYIRDVSIGGCKGIEDKNKKLICYLNRIIKNIDKEVLKEIFIGKTKKVTNDSGEEEEIVVSDGIFTRRISFTLSELLDAKNILSALSEFILIFFKVIGISEKDDGEKDEDLNQKGGLYLNYLSSNMMVDEMYSTYLELKNNSFKKKINQNYVIDYLYTLFLELIFNRIKKLSIWSNPHLNGQNEINNITKIINKQHKKCKKNIKKEANSIDFNKMIEDRRSVKDVLQECNKNCDLDSGFNKNVVDNINEWCWDADYNKLICKKDCGSPPQNISTQENIIKSAQYNLCKLSKDGKKVYIGDLPVPPGGVEKNTEMFNKYKVQGKDYMDLDSFKRSFEDMADKIK